MKAQDFFLLLSHPCPPTTEICIFLYSLVNLQPTPSFIPSSPPPIFPALTFFLWCLLPPIHYRSSTTFAPFLIGFYFFTSLLSLHPLFDVEHFFLCSCCLQTLISEDPHSFSPACTGLCPCPEGFLRMCCCAELKITERKEEAGWDQVARSKEALAGENCLFLLPLSGLAGRPFIKS